jgi:hypothetical protein
VVARRSGNDWYLAAMTDWTARTLDVPLTFLAAGTYAATIRVGWDERRPLCGGLSHREAGGGISRHISSPSGWRQAAAMLRDSARYECR